MNDVTKQNQVHAVKLADRLRNASGLRVFVTAEDILRICRSERELNFYYCKICSER